MLSLQLRQELVGLETQAEGVHLALHRGKVARHQLVQRGKALALLVAQPRRVAPQGFADEHAQALLGLQGVEADLEGEAAQRRFVELFEEVGGADEDAAETLHALQHLVDLGHLVVALGQAAAAQKAVGLVEQQHRAFGAGFFEHLRHVLLGLADELAGDVAGLAHHQRPAQGVCDVLGERRLPGAGRAVEAQGAAHRAGAALAPRRRLAAALQGFDDARQLEAAFGVQQRQVPGGHHRACAAFGLGAA